MCGIAGLLYWDAARAVDPALLDAMTDAVAHRGPDGRGTHCDGPLGLGHRRLAIIDLSEDATQPMPNEDGSVWVVLNGEIYNFQSLREELEGKGHTFRSHSDTEVLVHLYEEVGDRLVERLRGMFAFALWDAKRRRLLLARDRFGQKPLYYRRTEEGVWFGSEIKAILQDPSVERAADPLALHDYLTYGYVPAPRTAFRGILKLPPAHTLALEADGRASLRRYWQMPLAPKLPMPASEAAEQRLEEELLEHLDEAVRLRLVSDVPLGAFLSGGVDSSAVVASMCRSPGAVRTFSIGFAEQAFDESPFAAEVARYLGTQHEALTLTPEAFVGLERIAWHYGEPFADSSCLPTFAVSELARRHVTVALSGDGGDELLLGYHRYLSVRADERARQLPQVLAKVARHRVTSELVRRLGAPTASAYLSHNRLTAQLDLPASYLTRIVQTSEPVQRELFGPQLQGVLDGVESGPWHYRRLLEASQGETFTERCGDADAQAYLPDDILVKVDVASMAHGLECRAPLLDHRLAEFVGRLPARLKLRRFTGKRILKRALRGRLPSRPLTRTKMGFGIPLGSWFQGRLPGLLRERLLDPQALQRGWFQPQVVERLIDEHVSGRTNHQNVLFTLLMLETWQRLYIDPPVGAALPVPAGGAP